MKSHMKKRGFRRRGYRGKSIPSPVALLAVAFVAIVVGTVAGAVRADADSGSIDTIVNRASVMSQNASEEEAASIRKSAANGIVMLAGAGAPSIGGSGSDGNGSIVVTKTVVNQAAFEPPVDQEFDFTIHLDNDGVEDDSDHRAYILAADGSLAQSLTLRSGSTFQLKADQRIEIFNIEAGESYQVSEAAATGFTTSSENAEGTVAQGASANVSFINTYLAQTVTLSGSDYAKVEKTLDGEAWGGQQFTVSMKPNEKSFPKVEPETVTLASEDGAAGTSVSAAFGDITFDKPGVYTYTISEDVPQIMNPGVTYSSAIYTLTVTVTENTDATLSATATMTQARDDDGTATGTAVDDFVARFTNTYVEGSVTVHQVGEKHYIDNTGATQIKDGQFEFLLSANAETPDAPMPDDATTYNVGEQIYWPSITYTEVGTYKYDLTEVVPSDKVDGMTYDTSTIVATVSVQKEAGTETLMATVSYYDEANGQNVDEAVFTNTFTPQPVTVDLAATKTLDGRDSLSGESFDIVVKTTDSATRQAIDNGWITTATGLGDGVVAEGEASGLKDGVAQTVSLSSLVFDHVGVYRFTMGETAGSAKGMTYDTHACSVVVDVTYEDGKLVADVLYVGGENAFTNTYSPTPVTINGTDGSVQIQAKKSYQSNTYSYEDSFTFLLKETDNMTGVVGPTSQTSTVDMQPGNTETVSFSQSTIFAHAGTYTFEITEVLPDDATNGSYKGMTYDTHTCDVTVTVTDNAQEGKLEAAVTYGSSNTFTNTANPVPVTLDALNVTKTIKGGDSGWLDDDTFTMNLSASDGTPMPEKTSVVCTKDEPTQSFGSITYTSAGTYYYYVTEDNSNLPSDFKENTTTYTITVTTTPVYDGLAIAVDYGDDDSTSLQVENEYKSTVLSAMPVEVSKKLVGASATKADQFTIDMECIYGADSLKGNTSQSVSFGKTGDSATNLADGATVTQAFPDNILFSEVGEYEFKLTEEIPEGAVGNSYQGILYDTSVYYAVVTTSYDSATGGLTASVSYMDSEYNQLDAAPVFVNRYDPDAVVVDDIQVNKKLEGRDWIGSDKFMFALKDKATGDLVSQATVDSENEPATFDAIAYYEPGTYTYVMTESESENPMTLSDQSFDVTVIVEKDASGKLSATVSYADSDGTAIASAPTFVNDYVPGPAHQYINIQKIIDGRAWRSQDEYVFKLEGATGAEPMPDSPYATINMNTEPITWFDWLTFNDIGTYTYYVSEVKGNIIGIDYSDYVCTVTITTYDDPEDGILKSTIAYDGNTGASWASFTNTYNPVPATSQPIQVTKVLDGRAWTDDDSFTFVCTAMDGAPEPNSVTAMADINNQTVNFGDITFTSPGTYTYEVLEQAGSEGGVTYATEPLYYEVTVGDPGTGALQVTNTTVRYADGTTADPQFVNYYSADPTTIDNIQAKKVLEGRPWLDTDGFDFVLVDAQTDDEVDTETATKDNQTVTFKALHFEQAGTYTYTIKELHGDLAGMTYDDSEWKAVVTVKDDGQGNLVASLSYVGPDNQTTTPEFTNVYDADPVTVDDIEIQKELIGRDWRSSDVFSFYLSSEDPDAPMPETNPVVIDAETENHAIKFKGLTYASAGTYVYSVKETVDKEAVALKYDLEPKKITVKITPDYDNGTFKYQVLYTSLVTGLGDIDVPSSSTSVFTNIYAPTSVVAAPLSVSKQIEGRDWLDTDSFTVKLSSVDGTPMPASDTVTLTKDNQSASFGDIKYEYPGTYTYVMTEEVGDIKDMTYDQNEITATVTVVEGDKGQLVVDSVDYSDSISDGTDNLFVNEYTPGALTMSGSDIKVQKLLSAPDGIDVSTTSFSFTLKADDTTDLAGATTQTTTIDNVEPNKVATGSFSKDIVFKKAGTYTFSLTENQPTGSTAGITYDTSVHTITVEVTQNPETNNLQATILYDDESPQPVPFLNTYSASPVTVSGITATKVLQGRDWTSTDAFEFEMTEAGTTKVVSTATATESDKTVDMGSLTFKEAGTYYYTVAEKVGTEQGITYDSTAWTVIVDVVDNGTGQLSATYSYKAPQGATTSIPTFTNTYTSSATVGSVAGIAVDLTMDGRSASEGQFQFTLTPSDSASAALVPTTTFTNAAAAIDSTTALLDGTTSLNDLLGNLKLTNADAGKTYTWTLAETSKAEAGYTLDTTVYTVSIEVATDSQGATLLTVYLDGKAVTGDQRIVFTNSYYAATATPVSITATKELQNEALAGGEFSFTLTDQAGDVVATASNAADGTITFPGLAYDTKQAWADAANGLATKTTYDGADAIEYTYTVSEDTSSLPEGMHAVRSRFNVSVFLTDDGNGVLSAHVEYPADTTLVNAYETNAATLSFSGTKVVDTTQANVSAPDVTGKFTFTLTGLDGAPMPDSATAVNDASGTVDFGSVAYTIEDLADADSKTFTYQVSESGAVAGVTNDAAVKTITVTVTNEGDGKLTAVMDPESFSFTNTYAVAPATSSPTDTLGVAKTLDGKALAAGEFTFDLVSSDGTVAATGTNDASGSVALSSVTFDTPGTYAYTLREETGDAPGVTYDTTLYTVVATVTNTGEGTLDVAWSFGGAQAGASSVTFANSYHTYPGAASVVATKVLKNASLSAGEFSFELVGPDGSVVETATNDAAGAVAFTPLSFDTAGVYDYSIREVQGTDKNITYDTKTVKVTITVTEDVSTARMVATVAYDPENVFTNVYTAPEPVTPEKPDDTPTTDDTPKKDDEISGGDASKPASGTTSDRNVPDTDDKSDTETPAVKDEVKGTPAAKTSSEEPVETSHAVSHVVPRSATRSTMPQTFDPTSFSTAASLAVTGSSLAVCGLSFLVVSRRSRK
jgi:pilin isopeptide linkage protein